MHALWIIVVGVVLAGLLVTSGVTNQQTRTLNTTSNKTSSLPPTVSDLTSKKSLQLGEIPFGGSSKTNPSVCLNGGKISLDLLLDTSDSMSCNNSPGVCKINSLKTAVKNITNLLKDGDLIGIQTLQGNYISIDKYQNLKSDFDKKINALGTEDGTPTQKGLNFAKDELVKAKNKYPDYNHILIILTDGCPNSGQKPLIPAKEIKDLGIKIITLGIELGSAGKCDKLGGPEGAKDLMQQISTTPSDYFEADGGNLSEKLKNAFTKGAACVKTPSTTSTLTCASGKIGINLSIDTSGSFKAKNGGNIEDLKEGMRNFASFLGDEDVLAAQNFGKKLAGTRIHEIVEFDYFKNNKAAFLDGVDKFEPAGGTPLKDAVLEGYDKIKAVRSNYPSDYSWFLMLITDGGPNPDTQDPRSVSAQINGDNIKVVTIGVELDKDKNPPDAREILRESAYSPDYFFDMSSSDFKTVYERVSEKICKK